jgi:hypothetical protein
MPSKAKGTYGYHGTQPWTDPAASQPAAITPAAEPSSSRLLSASSSSSPSPFSYDIPNNSTSSKRKSPYHPISSSSNKRNKSPPITGEALEKISNNIVSMQGRLFESLQPATNAAPSIFSSDADKAAEAFVKSIDDARARGDDWLSIDDFTTMNMALVDDGKRGGAMSRSYLRLAAMGHAAEPSVRDLVQKILDDYRRRQLSN